jgi:predicted SnoaL-like aldol condensation-catalyzing enzyme
MIIYSITGLIIIILLTTSCLHKGTSEIRYQIVIDSLSKQIKTLSENNQVLVENKKLVADFYQELFGDKNIDAIDKYIGDTYIQHNPTLPDGKDYLKNGVKIWFKGAPKEKVDIQHLSADGDLVYIHTRSKNGGKISSIIDIFRLQNGKIVEHWDVIQEVPAKSANNHPMF